MKEIKDTPKTIKFPVKALPKAQQLLNQKAVAEMQFQTYVQGVFDALGLDGDWNLDIATWIISPKVEAEAVKETTEKPA